MLQPILRFRLFASLLVCISLVGCGTTIDPTSLSKPSSSKSVTLLKELTYLVPDGSKDVSLAPGIYSAELTGEGGTFYRGPDHCYSESYKKNPKLNFASHGGIWIPDAGDKQNFRLYYYIGTRKTPVPDVDVSDPAKLGLQPTPTAYVTAGVATGVLQALVVAERGKILFRESAPANLDLKDLLLHEQLPK